MRDSKLGSKDLIKIRKSLGGGATATTQTARIARKLAEKTTKRNKITVSVKRQTLDPEFEFGSDTYHRVVIKKGGVPKIHAKLTFEKGLFPDTEDGKLAKGSGWARVNRRMRAELDRRSSTGKAVRAPAALAISDIAPYGVKVRPHEGYSWQDAHKEHANKTMKPNDLKRGIKELAKKFPSAGKIAGWRVTGRRDKLINEFETKHPQVVKAGGLSSQSHINIRVQNINLPKHTPKKKVLKPNTTKLKGALKGVLKKANHRKWGGAAPLEAAFTSYATGGGTTGAATAAAATTGIGAGIKTVLRKAAQHAPGIARVAGKASVTLAIATAGYDVYRTVKEGVKAKQASDDAKANEKYMKDNYGSIEAATATRHAKDQKRAKKEVVARNLIK